MLRGGGEDVSLFAECEDETKRKKEFWWKLEWKVERKKESKLRFENMNVCIFVTRREYLIKRKKKEPLVSRNLSHKLKSYLKLKLSQVILRRYISVLNIASIYDLPFVYISINV